MRVYRVRFQWMDRDGEESPSRHGMFLVDAVRPGVCADVVAAIRGAIEFHGLADQVMRHLKEDKAWYDFVVAEIVDLGEALGPIHLDPTGKEQE